jgi:hypothetical protein
VGIAILGIVLAVFVWLSRGELSTSALFLLTFGLIFMAEGWRQKTSGGRGSHPSTPPDEPANS